MKTKHLLFLLGLIPSLVMGSAIIPPGGTPTIGGGISGGTDNSVIFINPANTIDQDNANFSYDRAIPGLNLFGFTLLEASTDPSAGGGLVAPVGSLAFRDNGGAGELWAKFSASNTSWSNLLTASSGWSLTGNPSTVAGTNFLGTTDAIDLVFKTNAVERFRLTSGGSIDTTLGLGVLHSDASGILSSSAVVLTSEVSGILPVANGGTGSATQNFVDLTTGQSVGGNKTFTGTISASNLSGTNTGDVTLGAFGATPNANGASLSGQVLTLQPADATNSGGITTGAQTLAGIKDFSSGVVIGSLTGVLHGSSGTVSASNVVLTSEVSGILPLANGGSNKNFTASAGSVVYSDADSFEASAVGTSGQVLKSNGASAPTFVTISQAFIKVNYLDVEHTTKPTDTSTTIDGATIITGDKVLFTVLSSSNNTIHQASVSGTTITWTLQSLYEGFSSTASEVDTVAVKAGTYFLDNLLAFNSTNGFFNILDNKITYTMADNTAASVFLELDTAVYHYARIEYSMQRGTNHRMGEFFALSDGTSCNAYDDAKALLGDAGTVLDCQMDGTAMQITFTTDASSATDTTFKRVIRIW